MALDKRTWQAYSTHMETKYPKLTLYIGAEIDAADLEALKRALFGEGTSLSEQVRKYIMVLMRDRGIGTVSK